MRVLVTGANRGIGAAMAKAAEARGHEVIRHGRRSGDIVCDLENLSDIPAAFGALDGPIDVLFNNAGVIGPDLSSLDGVDERAFVQTFTINTFAPLEVARAVLPALRMGRGRMGQGQGRTGRIVNTSSQMSWMGYAKSNQIAYRASKAALNKVMQGLATDLAPEGIPVVLVDPGWVRTDMGGADADEDPRDVTQGFLAIAEGLTMAHSGKFLRFTGEERHF